MITAIWSHYDWNIQKFNELQGTDSIYNTNSMDYRYQEKDLIPAFGMCQ